MKGDYGSFTICLQLFERVDGGLGRGGGCGLFFAALRRLPLVITNLLNPQHRQPKKAEMATFAK